jgi:hypothetical protein
MAQLGPVVGSDPISFEQWVEITQAQAAAAQRGVDAETVLASYGLTPNEWGTIGGWWTQKLYANTGLLSEYDRLSQHYREQFTPSRSPAHQSRAS